ncbi:response regulator [Neolewinella agarilytica]|uniref:response regulator n=1 Tax=Neolewinella agarilytica TaxID=478744 RepID=UPI002352571C|nr:response regulator [Neolewinella agarilytica]
MIKEVLNIFLLEDRPAEAELTKRAVFKFAPNAMFTMADSEESFLEKIHWGKYDIMLADYNLPAYNGLEALLYVKEHLPDLPFVFVTGMLNNEQKAADAILEGANGYVIKENMENLQPTVVRVLEESNQRREKARLAAEKTAIRKLMLQKALGMLEQATDFPDREVILDSLRKAMEDDDQA